MLIPGPAPDSEGAMEDSHERCCWWWFHIVFPCQGIIIPGLLSFYHKSMLNFIKGPLRFYRTFSTFNLPMGYVLLIDFWILKRYRTPGIDLCEIWNFCFQHAIYYLGLFVLWFNDYGLHLERFQPRLPCSSLTFSERWVWNIFFSLFRFQIQALVLSVKCFLPVLCHLSHSRGIKCSDKTENLHPKH